MTKHLKIEWNESYEIVNWRKVRVEYGRFFVMKSVAAMTQRKVRVEIRTMRLIGCSGMMTNILF